MPEPSFTITATIVPTTDGSWNFTHIHTENHLPLFDTEAERDTMTEALVTIVRSLALTAVTTTEAEDIMENVVASVRIQQDPSLMREAVGAVLAADPERAAFLRRRTPTSDSCTAHA
jgi:hypothetical protein